MEPQASQLLALLNNPSLSFLLFIMIVWTYAWKGVALWKSAHNNQFKWFVVMLILNTFGILEIVYLFYFGKPKKKTIDRPSAERS